MTYGLRQLGRHINGRQTNELLESFVAGMTKTTMPKIGRDHHTHHGLRLTEGLGGPLVHIVLIRASKKYRPRAQILDMKEIRKKFNRCIILLVKFGNRNNILLDGRNTKNIR